VNQRAAREEIDSLVEKLRLYSDEYFKKGRPSVSDREYDRLFDRLRSLEERHPDLVRPDSPSLRVGSDLIPSFPEVAHTIPVLSLDKSYTYEELGKWIEKTRLAAGESISFTLEEKIDGVSIVLHYESGRLDRAVTRGNGIVGNAITANVKTIGAVPLSLSKPLTIAVRGEIYLPKDLFERINASLDVHYANPRNLAAGTLRRIKPSEVARFPLDIFIYEGYMEPSPDTHFAILELLGELGFKLNSQIGFFSDHHDLSSLRARHPNWHIGSLEDIEGFITGTRERRDRLSYEIDGLVLKVNEIGVRERLGSTGHHPRWEIAFKFESPTGMTTVGAIELQIGRTGRATPVARVAPVLISGSTISNVTLHNQEYVDLLELAVGDRVKVSKRGDVIPAVEEVLEKNDLGNTTWRLPERCPTCETVLVKVGAHHYCPNIACYDLIRGRLQFFSGRGQMDIENLGPGTIDFLIEKGLVKDIPDLYSFDIESLADEMGFGPKKVQLLREGIVNSLQRPYQTVLVSLGIPELGQKVSELLIGAGFRDIDGLLDAVDQGNLEVFTAIHGIGEKTAGSIIRELSRPETRRRIADLKKAGLRFRVEDEVGSEAHVTDMAGIFQGQTWCITGSFELFQPREKAALEIKKRAGKVASSVSSRTTHLLAGGKPGSKLEKALSRGVKVVSEAEFLVLLGREADGETG
jgi:DNA ligase (NAD+)